MKKLVALSLVSVVLILSGCGNNEAESRLKAQQALDNGNYASAISTLESKTNKTVEDNMLLASSYMGKAGFSLTDTIAIVGKSVSANNVNTDDFANFSKSVADTKDPTTLQNLQSAIFYYNAVSVVTNKSNNGTSNSISTIGDRDLYLGLAYLTKATVAVSYLGDVAKLQSAQNIDNEMLASACAIVNIYVPSISLPNGCTSVLRSKSGNYTRVDVILDNGNGKVFSRLANANATELLLTDYSSKELTPIQIDAKDVSIKDVLVDTINNAFTLIEKIAPTDVKSDVRKFKNEIGTDLSGNVSSKTLADYISKQTK